jgi:hypothetical protein
MHSRYYLSGILSVASFTLWAAHLSSALAQEGEAIALAKLGEAHLRPARLPALSPPKLPAEATMLQLPGIAQGSAVGGGGRYIIFHLKELRKLAVFDANEGKIRHYISLDSDDIGFTAGADKLVIVLRDQKIIQRWNLANFERELTKTIATTQPISMVVMGSASNGPIFVGMGEKYGNQSRFFDLDTLEPCAVTIEGNGQWRVSGGGDCVVRASADGRVFTMWRLGTSPSGLQDVVITGNRGTIRYEHESVGDILPSADGRLLYTGAGIYTNELKRVGTVPISGGVPSVQGNFYLRQAVDKSGDINLHLAGEERVLASFPGVLPTPIERRERDRNPATVGMQRIFYIPSANILVTMPLTNDHVIVRAIDLDAVLEKSEVDYLYFKSLPVVSAVAGKTYQYTLAVKSKRGNVKYQVASGPEGMKISESGVVSWAVPSSASNTTADVILSVGDASGQEEFQVFSISVTPPSTQGTSKTLAVTKPTPNKRTNTVTTAPSVPKSSNAKKIGGTKTEQVTKSTTTAALEKSVSIVPVTDGKALQVTPVILDGDKAAIKLPATFQEVAVGGGGRFLILHLRELRQLAVFDVSLAKVVKYLSLGSDDVAFTAGIDRIVVALRDKKVIQRWSLRNFERELSVSAPTGDSIRAVGMGNASNGPVLIQTFGASPHQSSLIFVDGTKLQKLETFFATGRNGNAFHLRSENANVRASSDGSVFLIGGDVISLSGNVVTPLTYHGGPDVMNNMLPNADGSIFYSSQSLLNRDLKPIGVERPSGLPVPSVQPGFYLTLSAGDSHFQHHEQRTDRVAKETLSIHIEGELRPLVTLEVPTSLSRPNRSSSSPSPWSLGIERRFYFVPEAQALVQLPSTNDQLLIYKVDIEALLEKSQVDYLFVNSRAPATTMLGETFQYQLSTKSKRGGVTYELSSGPEGMKISETGLLTWPVPKSLADSRQAVIVSVKDMSGQEAFHTFTITLPENESRKPVQITGQFTPIQQTRIDRREAIAERQAELASKTQAAPSVEFSPEKAAAAQQNAEDQAAQIMKGFHSVVVVQAHPVRKWTDTEGNQIDATLIRSFGGFVTLSIAPSGENHTALMTQLSPADQEYVRNLNGAAAAERKRAESDEARAAAERQLPMRLLGQGLFSHLSVYRAFPAAYSADPNGKPLLSWRVHLLRYIGGDELYRMFRIQEPWDSEHNKQLVAYMPKYYCAAGAKREDGKTTLLAITGENCVFNGTRRIAMKGIVDGTSKTAAMVQASDTNAVIWTKPDDFAFSDGASVRKLMGDKNGGLNVLLADGNVRHVSSENTDEILERVFIRNDGQSYELK